MRRHEKIAAVLVVAALACLWVAGLLAVNASAHAGCHSRACEHRVAAKHWKHEQRMLSQGVKAMLARLRGCETRGIPYPLNYRNAGHHFGAYQYSWGPRSAGARAGFRVRPDRASPAEQDVRTARFFPLHRSEWACRA